MITTDRNKRHLSLISIKDNGGLVYPSDDIMTIIRTCEKYFKLYVRGTGSDLQINASKKLRANLHHAIISELSETRPNNILFAGLLQHDIDNHCFGDDLHSTQVMKAFVSSFLKMRLFRYGQEYTQQVIRKDSLGKRQQMSKLMLFNGV
jgi:hypothetical protein